MSKFRKADTTESALHAVEEALKIDFKGGGTKPGGDRRCKEGQADDDRDGRADARGRMRRPRSRRCRPGAKPPATERKGHERTRTRRAANDDVRSVGNLLYALQRRPSYTPFWTALLLTLVWAGLGIAFGVSVWGDEIASLGGVEDVRGAPQLLGLDDRHPRRRSCSSGAWRC